MTVVVHTTPPLDDLPASDGESLRILGTLKLAGINPETRTASWSANGESNSGRLCIVTRMGLQRWCTLRKAALEL